MKHALLLSLISLLVSDLLIARTWTSIDGKELEAEYLSSTETEVKLRRKSDYRVFTLALDRLSQEDRDWVNKKVTAEAPVEEKTGAPLPKAVTQLVEEKGTLIFEDDFNREDPEGKEELGEAWVTNSKTRAQGEKQNDLVDGTLVMTISPKANHAISTRHSEEQPFKDLVVSLRMNIPKDGSLKLAYNDRQHKEVHAGHINGVTIQPNKIKLDDERTGRFNLKYREDKSSSEAKKAMKNSQKEFSLDLDPDEWHDVVTLHRGETLTVWIDGDEVASFSSPGFGHETKRDLAFAVPKKATVDDLKMWSLQD